MNYFNSIDKNRRSNKLQRFLAVYILVDICLLPYIRQLKCLPSMLLLAAWYVLEFKKLKCDKEFIAFIFTVFAVVASACVGTLVLPATVPYGSLGYGYISGSVSILSNTIAYSVIYIYIFLYYFFFKEMMKREYKLLYRILKIIFITMCIMAVYYLISPASFYSIRNFWTLSGDIQKATLDSSTYYRYTYSFSDPNNISIMAIAIMVLVFENRREKDLIRFAMIAGSVIIVFASMSTQGMIALGVYFLIKAFKMASEMIQGGARIKKTAALVGLLIIVVVCFALPVFLENDVVVKAMGRMSNNSNSFSMRLSIWETLLKEKSMLPYLLFGNGGTVVLDGQAVSTHNGHLYLIYAYGMIAYMAFLYIFFRKKRGMTWGNYLFEIPLFICFTINVGLIDARYSFVMAFVMAIGYATALDQKKSDHQPKAI